jgi:uridine kinase
MHAARRLLLESVIDEYLSPSRTGRVLVAIDGIDGAGKTVFADDLAAVMHEQGRAAFRASIDGFHRPRAKRYARGPESPEGFYLDSYDYATFRRVLIDPFRMGGSTAFVPAVHDVDRDTWVEPVWLTAPVDAVLIVDGIFLNRPELRELWDFSIWLDTTAEVAAERMSRRDGSTTVKPRYVEGQALYLADADPVAAASVVIDNN